MNYTGMLYSCTEWVVGEGRRGVQEDDMCPRVATAFYIVQSHISLDSNAMLLPGRVPGYKDSGVKLLPTKRLIWELYFQAAETSLLRAVASPNFTQFWRPLLTNVVVMKPMSDLCWQNNTAIVRSA